MVRTPLNGVEVKLAAARRHAQAFQGEHKAFVKGDLYHFRSNMYDEGRRYVYRVDGQPPDLPDHWSGLIGDFIHNLRSALDHLAYQLVLLNGNQPNHSSFPIMEREFRYVDGVAQPTISLVGVSDAVLEEIKAVQPYGAPHGISRSPLWWLKELDNIDKHRHLLLYASVVRGAHLRNAGTPDVHFRVRPLKRNDVVVVLTYPVPHVEPDQQVRDIVDVVLADNIGPKAVRGKQIVGLIADLYLEVEIIIDRFRPMFNVDPVGRGPEYESDYLMRLHS